MTWVAWRQQRLQILVCLGVVVAFAAVMTWVRFGAAAIAHDPALVEATYERYVDYQRLVLLALPVLMGTFAGAPLFAAEIERGTHVFGLTQGISRNRWWATKLAGVPVVLGMTVLGLVSSWSDQVLGALTYNSRLNTPMFEVQGLVPAAYTALAFTLSAALGLLLRNGLAAMVLTIVAYVPLVGVVASVLRPSYATPVSEVAPRLPEGAWRRGTTFLDGAGNEVPSGVAGCVGRFEECLAERGLTVRWAFHPADRFWSFQAIEAGLFAALCAALLAVGAWALHKRLRLG
ncbi:ABC transporter permease [Saccharothrix lopnurensis]|uniref:ABC transporter permease n=1 Tax=Saccharothrix lopnurensis TaxID=1670621 RepID=A0ABW1P4G0_9PSEU